MHIINAQFTLTSPMFLGGFNTGSDNQDLSIRPTAIKGALRFWWRAINYASIRKNAANTQAALIVLHKEESVLFGAAAAEGAQSGQSLVQLRLSENVNHTDVITPITDTASGNPNLTKFQGCKYLLGQGLCSNRLLRPYVNSGSQFSLQLAFKPQTSTEQIEQVRQALLTFGLLGCLGSRARKGYGSVQLVHADESGSKLDLPESRQAYKDAILKLCKHSESLTELPPFTALSAYTMADISASGRTGIEVLDKVGNKQQLYRSYGSAGKARSGEYRVNGQAALQVFADDHDTLYRYLKDRTSPNQPDRVVFGLPHNVRFSDNSKVKLELSSTNKTRRASPLFIHVHQFGNEYVAVQTLLGAQYSPPNAKLKYNNKPYPMQSIKWNVITDYLSLNEYVGANSRCSGFTEREAIFKGSQL